MFGLQELLYVIIRFLSVRFARTCIDSDIWPAMKRTLSQIVNLLMAFVVLMSSTGFGLVEHSCQMRGKKKTVVTAFSDVKTSGCTEDGLPMKTDQTIVKKTPCCQDEQGFENVETQSSLSQQVAKFVKVITEAVLTSVTTLLTWIVGWVFDTNTEVSTSFPAPPSPSGRDILTLVRSLLI